MNGKQFGQAAHLMTTVSQLLSPNGFDALVKTGYLALLFKAASAGTLKSVQLDALRSQLGFWSYDPNDPPQRVMVAGSTKPVTVTKSIESATEIRIAQGLGLFGFFDGKVETLFPEQVLVGCPIPRSGMHNLLVNELGGPERVEVKIAQFIDFLGRADIIRPYVAVVTDKCGRFHLLIANAQSSQTTDRNWYLDAQQGLNWDLVGSRWQLVVPDSAELKSLIPSEA